MYFSITIYNKTCNYLNTKPTQRKFIQTKDQKLNGEEVFFITSISPVYNNISTLSYCASLTPTYPILLLKSWETSSVQSHKKSTHSQHLHRKPSSRSVPSFFPVQTTTDSALGWVGDSLWTELPGQCSKSHLQGLFWCSLSSSDCSTAIHLLLHSPPSLIQ